MAFFAAAPFLVVFAAELFPVTGAIAQITLALVVFLLGETARRALGRPLLRRVFANELAFDTYYRDHPPRGFLYYVLYPLLFPYWLANVDARREFLLYKGYTWPAFALLAASLVVQYFRFCPPELTLADFAPIAAGSLLAEVVVMLMFLMPIVTSVVHFHRTRAPRRLSALFLVGLVSMGYAVYRVERRRDPIVSFATRTRVRLRSEARPEQAQRAHEDALAAAFTALHSEGMRTPRDGRVTGTALEAAHARLLGFYKNDEAHAFELWYTRGPTELVTLFFPARRGHSPIWLSRDASGLVHHETIALSSHAQKALGVSGP